MRTQLAGTAATLVIMLVSALWVFIAIACIQQCMSLAENFCRFEKFAPTCMQDAVVLIQDARYGRMQYNRCIERDYGYVGCQVNVSAILDARCSGKQSCSMLIPDPDLDTLNPCPRDLSRYLQVDYICQEVRTPWRHDCQTFGETKYAKTGYVSSYWVAKTLGIKPGGHCSWTLPAQPGQHINFTILEFSPRQADDAAGSEQTECRCNFTLTDIGPKSQVKQETLTCSGVMGERFVYSSSWHQVAMSAMCKPMREKGAEFLVKYEIYGDVMMEGGQVNANRTEVTKKPSLTS